MVLILSLISWSIIPAGLTMEYKKRLITQVASKLYLLDNQTLVTTSTSADISYGVLFLLAISGLNVYGIIIAG